MKRGTSGILREAEGGMRIGGGGVGMRVVGERGGFSFANAAGAIVRRCGIFRDHRDDVGFYVHIGREEIYADVIPAPTQFFLGPRSHPLGSDVARRDVLGLFDDFRARGEERARIDDRGLSVVPPTAGRGGGGGVVPLAAPRIHRPR